MTNRSEFRNPANEPPSAADVQALTRAIRALNHLLLNVRGEPVLVDLTAELSELTRTLRGR
jgi:hypothetical protein